MKNWIAYVFQLVLACVFCYSGYSKILSLDSFELYVYKVSFLSWNLSALVARLLIGFEFAIAFTLILNYRVKQIYYLLFVVLALFTVFLFVQILRGEDANCHCFGEAIQMNPLESILKNILIGGFAYFLFRYSKPFDISWFKHLRWIGVFSVFSTILILDAPDFILIKIYNIEKPIRQGLDFTPIDSVNTSDVDLTQGKNVLCMFSADCKYCLKAASKLSMAIDKNDSYSNILIAFFGEEDKITRFRDTTGLEMLPFVVLEPKAFFPISGRNIPTIYFLEEGEAVKRYGYRDLNADDIHRFLQ